MGDVSATLVRELRDKTGLPMMKCKKALEENAGDVARAEEALRKQGMKTAAREGRNVSEGAVGSYIHHNRKIGVILEMGCETDFVAKNADFVKLINDLCMHIAASNPRWIRREEVDAATTAKEREIASAQVTGKPAQIVDKIVTGKLDAFFKEQCLLEQAYIENEKMTVQELIKEPNRTAEIKDYIEKSRELYGTQSFDQHLIDLYQAGIINLETAKLAATNAADLERALYVS